MYATGYLPLLAKKMPENIRGVKVLNEMLSDSVMEPDSGDASLQEGDMYAEKVQMFPEGFPEAVAS